VLSDVPEAFPEINDKLAKGLTVTLLHEVTRGGQSFVFGCRVYYDLWDESYGVTTFVGNGAEAKHTERDRKKVMALCDEVPLDGHGTGDEVAVTSRLDPVSDDQMEKTRQWLATRGIGNSSKAIVGRAVGAITSLKEERSVSRTCKPNQGAAP
jgi:hypothetical protein